MIGVEIENGFLDFSNIEFECPFCGKKYVDDNDIYLNRCNKNKTSITKIKCECGNIFSVTYNTYSDIVAFK